LVENKFMAQIKYQFDTETNKKIITSLFLTLCGVAGAFLIALSNGIAIKEALMISLGAFGSWLVNIGKEWITGQ